MAARGGARRLRDPAAAEPPYAYLIYPHKPIVAYVPDTAQLLSEYCVEFPDLTGATAPRPPARLRRRAGQVDGAHPDENRVIGRANMHLVGRQLDPARVRRDLWRLSPSGSAAALRRARVRMRRA